MSRPDADARAVFELGLQSVQFSRLLFSIERGTGKPAAQDPVCYGDGLTSLLAGEVPSGGGGGSILNLLLRYRLLRDAWPGLAFAPMRHGGRRRWWRARRGAARGCMVTYFGKFVVSYVFELNAVASGLVMRSHAVDSLSVLTFRRPRWLL